MWNIVKKMFVVVLLNFMPGLFVVQGLYIKTGYQQMDRNKHDHSTGCVQIKPNDADSHEPYYMCKGPEFPLIQPNVPTGDFGNFNYQHVSDSVDVKINGENYHNINQPQTLYFGNVYQEQRPQQNLNGESFHDKTQSVIPSDIQHYTFPAADSQQIYSPSSSHTNTQFSNANPNYCSFYGQNNNVNIPETDLDLSKTDTLPAKEINQNYENKMASSQDINTANSGNNNPQQFPTKAIEHHVNSKQFNALLQEEVLGTPNLAFSHDEMLPVQNIYSEPKSETPMIADAPYIPPEYLDDPILRAFYNIDLYHKPASNIEEPYMRPIIQHNNPVLQAPSLSIGNDDCNNLMTPGYPLSSKLFAPITSNNCCDSPLIFRPIFIAVPLITSLHHDQMANAQPTFRIFGRNDKGTTTYDSIQSRLNKDYTFNNSYHSPSVVNKDNSSKEDLLKKNSPNPPKVITNPSQPQTNSTEAPESSEEDLFVEEFTTKADKLSNNNDENSLEDKQDDKRDKVEASTTLMPHTTARTFKTMMHAAKIHSKLANAERDNNNHNQLVQNKRHVKYMETDAYSKNLKKRQYVTKLEQNYE